MLSIQSRNNSFAHNYSNIAKNLSINILIINSNISAVRNKKFSIEEAIANSVSNRDLTLSNSLLSLHLLSRHPDILAIKMNQIK